MGWFWQKSAQKQSYDFSGSPLGNSSGNSSGNPVRQYRGWRRGLGLLLGLGLTFRLIPLAIPIGPDQLRQDDRALMFLDRSGQPLGTVLSPSHDRTLTVPLAQISPTFVAAILAAEDQRFYQHWGVDWVAGVRAVGQALETGEVVSGASTISMQLARLWSPSPENIWVAKLREIWVAWRLEAGLSKSELLAAYLNRLPMGSNLYGVEAAARFYFGVPAADLTWSQATRLAAIPNDPNGLNPYAAPAALDQRQAYILDRLVATGQLTRLEATTIASQTPTLALHDPSPLFAPQALFWLSDQIPPSWGAQVPTTIDRSLQAFVQAQVQQVTRALVPQNVTHGAALVIDNATGEVLAYVGSPDYFEAVQGRNDGVQALRQPGSTLKPFLYQLAFESGWLDPTDRLEDSPAHYPIPGAQLYSPTDYSGQFQGPVRVRLALANSLNLPAVRLLEQVTVPRFLERLQTLGFGSLAQSSQFYGLGLALGSGEVNLWELGRAYATLAREGRGLQLTTIPGLETQPGSIATVPQLDPVTSQLVTHMLADAPARAQAFGVDSALRLPFATAVKTGTSSGFRDTWTVGYSRRYTVATWVGNFDGSAMVEVSGVTGAAPLWHRIMLKLHETDDPEPFTEPDLPQVTLCAEILDQVGDPCLTPVQEYTLALSHLPIDPGAIRDSEPAPLTPHTSPSAQVAVHQDFQPASQADRRPSSNNIVFPESGDRFFVDDPALDDPALDASALDAPVLDASRPRMPEGAATFPPSNPTQGEYGRDDRSPQRIQFQLAQPPQTPVTWVLNGQPLATTQTGTLDWSLQVGDWEIEAKTMDWSDSIRFRVENLGPSQLKPGFTVISPP